MDDQEFLHRKDSDHLDRTLILLALWRKRPKLPCGCAVDLSVDGETVLLEMCPGHRKMFEAW